MRIEITVLDLSTALEFAKASPPDGVTVEPPVGSEKCSTDGGSALSVVIEIGVVA
jgi:hypothetical protein